MSSHQPGNYEVPNTVSFVALVIELERRSRSTVDPFASNFCPARPLEEMERSALQRQLLDLEHNLEKRILCQLEGSLIRRAANNANDALSTPVTRAVGQQTNNWCDRIKQSCARLVFKIRSLTLHLNTNPFEQDSANHDEREHRYP